MGLPTMQRPQRLMLPGCARTGKPTTRVQPDPLP